MARATGSRNLAQNRTYPAPLRQSNAPIGHELEITICRNRAFYLAQSKVMGQRLAPNVLLDIQGNIRASWVICDPAIEKSKTYIDLLLQDASDSNDNIKPEI